MANGGITMSKIPSTVVIVPTVGSPELTQCVTSVLEQTYGNTTCLVVVDGVDFVPTVVERLAGISGYEMLTLPYNTGAGGHNGQRIRASIPALVPHDVVLFTDEDNWFESNHVETCVASLAQGSQWCYSLRQIASKEGKVLGPDNCESLGRWPVWVSDQHFMVDTSCYCLPREIAARMGPAWLTGGWGEDRQFYANLSRFFPDFACTGSYTVNYRLGGNPNSVNWEFFQQGNVKMAERYPEGLPWQGPTIRI